MRGKILQLLGSLALVFSHCSPVHAIDDSYIGPHYNGVRFVQQNGIMTGYEDGKFHADDSITRGMIATILYRVAGSPAVYGTGFADVPASSFYKKASTWAQSNGVMTGNQQPDGRFLFDGQQPVKRQDLALIFHRLASHSIYSTVNPNPENDLEKGHYAYKAVNFVLNAYLMESEGNGYLKDFKAGEPADRGTTATLIQRVLSPNYPYSNKVETTNLKLNPRIPVSPATQADLNRVQEYSVSDGFNQVKVRGFHDDALTKAIFEGTNRQRALNLPGASNLNENSVLNNAARVRAEELAVLYSHTRPNGTAYFRAISYQDYGNAAENIVMRFNYNSSAGPSYWSNELLTMWMNSEGHRANILNTDHRELGVGSFIALEENGDLTVYAVQLFSPSGYLSPNPSNAGGGNTNDHIPNNVSLDMRINSPLRLVMKPGEEAKLDYEIAPANFTGKVEARVRTVLNDPGPSSEFNDLVSFDDATKTLKLTDSIDGKIKGFEIDFHMDNQIGGPKYSPGIYVIVDRS